MPLPAKQPDSHVEPLEATDGELLMRFARHRDRAALEELVGKHGPMVMAVCRQVLGSRADAEDAFQATFLILARRAASIERQSSVAGWLYRVAHRTAMRLARRRRRDQTEPLNAEPAGELDVFSIIHQRELQRLLHQELESLPDRYRDPLVLFYFHGLPREQIADELECTDAAVKGRLARGRKMLRLALARRGVGLSVAIGACVAAMPASAAVLPALVEKTVRACASLAARGGAASSCSTQTIQLANEGVRAMTIATAIKALAIPAAVGVATMIAVARIPGEDPADSPRGGIAAGDLTLAAATEVQTDAGPRTGEDVAVPFVASATADAPNKLKLNLRATWPQVLEWFAEEAGLSLDWQKLPSGVFNYPAPDRELTIPQAMGFLNKYLLQQGFALVRNGETLHVLNLEDETDLHTLRDLISATPLEDLPEQGILRTFETAAIGGQDDSRGLPPDTWPNPLTAEDHAIGADRSELDAAGLSMLEDYYTQRVQANGVRQEAKQAVISAYDKTGPERERLQDRARQLEAEADVLELRAEADLYTARAGLLRERREEKQMTAERQTTAEPQSSAGTLSPGDRLLIRLHVSMTDPSQNLNEIARVEAGGTLPLGPLLGRVDVTGKTLREVEDEVRAIASEIFREARVQITHAAATPESP